MVRLVQMLGGDGCIHFAQMHVKRAEIVPPQNSRDVQKSSDDVVLRYERWIQDPLLDFRLGCLVRCEEKRG